MNKNKNQHIISKVEPGSIADELELEPGDILLSINGKEIEDVFDYHYLIHDEYLTAVFLKADGKSGSLRSRRIMMMTSALNLKMD